MSAKKCPTPCKGTGEAITNRKEKRMPTQSLTSDELATLISEQLEYFELDVLWSTLAMPTGFRAAIHVDERFTGPHVRKDSNMVGGALFVVEQYGPSLHDALLTAYEALLNSAPSFKVAS